MLQSLSSARRRRRLTTSHQDELAETQVPSPGYAGVNDEIANESFEYDVYEYFGELEYGSDSYWDARIKHLENARAGEKRKSADDGEEEEEEEAAAIKKRRKDAGLEPRDNVVFVPFEERLAPLPPRVPDEGQFALLPDWKERFPDRVDESPIRKGKQMPADMRRAAEAEDEEEEEGEEEGEDLLAGEDQMDMDSTEDDEEDDAAAGLDQDVIMQVLRQRLADSGLGDVDESVFKDAIAKMLSGEGDGEDALGGLTTLLLGQKDGGGKAFEGFLAGQGVDLNRTEEEEGGDDEANGEDGEGEDDISEPTSKTRPTTTPRRSAAKPPSASISTPNHKLPTTRGKSKSTRSTTATATTATNANTSSKPTSPIVVPSPPPVASKASRKRRAPSLDEPAVPQPEAPSSSAKPAAKRRRTPGAEPPTNEPEAAPPSFLPGAVRRTTRSAANAAGKGGR